MLGNMQSYEDTVILIVRKYLLEAKIIFYNAQAGLNGRFDIKVALDNGIKIGSETILKIMRDVEEASLPVDFDIIDFNDVDKLTQETIITSSMKE